MLPFEAHAYFPTHTLSVCGGPFFTIIFNRCNTPPPPRISGAPLLFFPLKYRTRAEPMSIAYRVFS